MARYLKLKLQVEIQEDNGKINDKTDYLVLEINQM